MGLLPAKLLQQFQMDIIQNSVSLTIISEKGTYKWCHTSFSEKMITSTVLFVIGE